MWSAYASSVLLCLVMCIAGTARAQSYRQYQYQNSADYDRILRKVERELDTREDARLTTKINKVFSPGPVERQQMSAAEVGPEAAIMTVAVVSACAIAQNVFEYLDKDAARSKPQKEIIQKEMSREDKAFFEYLNGMTFLLNAENDPQAASLAVTSLKKSADLGFCGASNMLGICCWYGNGVQKNQAAAIEWWRKAAEQNDGLAQIYLGDRYCLGDAVAQDSAEAARWYRKAAEQGYARAQTNKHVYH